MLKIKEIKPKIGFIGVNRQSILEDLNFVIKNGFDCYEIQAVKETTGKKDFNLKLKVINQIKKILKENNIYLNLHISHCLDLCSLNSKVSKVALDIAKREIFLAHQIGVKQITIHAGHRDLPEKRDIIAKNFRVVIENLKNVVKLGEAYGIKIGLENGLRDNLCKEAKDLLKVVNSVKGLKITFDTGHANTINLDVTNYFKKVKNLVINIHIHDNDGSDDQHKLIGEGNINFKKFLKECKNANYYGPFIFEVFPPQENVLKGRERFLKLWNQV